MRILNFKDQARKINSLRIISSKIYGPKPTKISIWCQSNSSSSLHPNMESLNKRKLYMIRTHMDKNMRSKRHIYVLRHAFFSMLINLLAYLKIKEKIPIFMRKIRLSASSILFWRILINGIYKIKGMDAHPK